jgi:threonine/homoserine/homoserine lactone efflux protein
LQSYTRNTAHNCGKFSDRQPEDDFMDLELLTAFSLFALVSSITPGPNNLMLMASGANFGIRRTVPHMLGIGIGFVIMVILVGIGLVGVFDAYPVSYDILRVVSIIYLVYLAWKIATAAPPEPGKAAGKPFTFVQAALFQWVNPKAWAMALTAVTVYAPGRSLEAIFWVAFVFGVINLPSVSCWTLLGRQIQPLLTSGRRLQTFNFLMAGLLLATVVQASFG